MIISKGDDNDILHDDEGNDELFGGNGNDQLVGGDGDDLLFGGDGDDILAGSFPTTLEAIDPLMGGKGNDVFVLGNKNAPFYTNDDRKGYAQIQDFQQGQDLIQLHKLPGGNGTYSLNQVGVNIEIFITQPQGISELIGIVENVQGLILNNDFSMV